MEIGEWVNCLKIKKLNHVEFLQLCMITLLCPCPGWCWVQREIMKRYEVSEPEACIKSMLFCCIGLALNREKIRDKKNWDKGFPIDLCLFIFCGYCVMISDSSIALATQSQAKKPSFEATLSSFCDPLYCFQSRNFIPCTLMCLCPIPGYCCLQAWTVPNNEFIFSFLRACLLGPFGCAWNRHIIRKAKKYELIYCEDCLYYSLGCCHCMISQEFIDGKKSPKRDQTQRNQEVEASRIPVEDEPQMNTA